MKFKKLLWITGFCTLMLLSSSSLEAASGESGKTYSGVAIGDNPADFTVIINGKSYPSEYLANPFLTDLFYSNCSNDSSRSYVMTESENPRIMKLLMKEINFSHSIYADPASWLTPNFTVATHLAKGDLIIEKGRMTVNLRIEDRQGNVRAQSKVSGPQKSYFELIEEATRSLGYQMCKPEPKKDKKNIGCPYLWDITFKQSGTVNTNRCFGSGLSDEEAMSPVEGYAYFPNVLIRPSEEYELTWKEDDLCEPYRKNDIQNNYSAKSKGDTYQKIDGYDGMDADVVYLRVRNMHKGEKKMIFEYGSISMRSVLSKVGSFKRSENRSSFMLNNTCGESFTFTPISVYKN